ncbi:uncharacterized protein LOC133487681 isoform X2 [Phyllopteryx taeniolatus]|uniref:uncharacterized protein LOC133487681 isoform X2 n=1 Tax=Phyllopteryx taeniolatus TaxID=161469 RepID=UPI002AD5A9B0|nr:uncharacterized protein LOC133487681 isoform X2 [Phyllopteryx taeniolatus]
MQGWQFLKRACTSFRSHLLIFILRFSTMVQPSGNGMIPIRKAMMRCQQRKRSVQRCQRQTKAVSCPTVALQRDNNPLSSTLSPHCLLKRCPSKSKVMRHASLPRSHAGVSPGRIHVCSSMSSFIISLSLTLMWMSSCASIPLTAIKMAEYTIHPPSKVSHSIPSPDPAVGGLSLESFEGDAKEVWNIGPPVLESSVCGEEESGSGNQKGEEVQPSETKPFSNYDTSLEVQVQSVVHVVGQPTFSSTQAAPRGKYLIKKQLSTSTPSTSKDSIHSRRQVVLNTEEDWEREKRMYVQSVHRHISEASDAAQDAVSELWGLMTHVGHDSSGRPWQHPSDLTCRNYKAHLRNPEMKMSLHEWQAKNMGTHKRFEKVQKVFERSPVP